MDVLSDKFGEYFRDLSDMDTNRNVLPNPATDDNGFLHTFLSSVPFDTSMLIPAVSQCFNHMVSITVIYLFYGAAFKNVCEEIS